MKRDEYGDDERARSNRIARKILDTSKKMDEITVYQYLDRIVAQPICSIGRASNMLWLGIGDKIKALTRLGKEVEISTYTLHIQSTWRIISKEEKEILFASSDFLFAKKRYRLSSRF